MHHKDLVYVLSSFKFTLTSIQIIEYPLLNSSWYFSLFSMLKLQLMIIKLPFKNKSKFQLIQIWIRVKTFYFQEMKMTKLFHSHAYVYNIIYIYIYIYIYVYIYISFYHCWYIIYKIQVIFDPILRITADKVLKILKIDQILLSGCLYFVRYWAIHVLKLFVNQVVTS